MKLVAPKNSPSHATRDWLDQVPSPARRLLIIVGCGIAMLIAAAILIDLGVVS